MSQFAWNYQSLQLPTYQLPASIRVTFSGAPIPAPVAESIKDLTTGTDQTHRLRDGELILFRRSDSRIWQYKFKQESGRWYRASTRKSVLEQAKRVAMDLHDEARYRERLGLAPQDGVFAQKLVQKNSEAHGDDRHSKNGYPINPLQKPKPMGIMPRAQQVR